MPSFFRHGLNKRFNYEGKCIHSKSSFLNWYFSSQEYANLSEKKIRNQLIGELRKSLPSVLKTFVNVSVDKTPAAVQKSTQSKFRNFRRWAEIQSTVGWIGILLSQSFSSDAMLRLTDLQFEQFKKLLLLLRPELQQRTLEHWPDCPSIMFEIGGTVS